MPSNETSDAATNGGQPEPEFPVGGAPEVPPGRDPRTGDTQGDAEPVEQPQR